MNDHDFVVESHDFCDHIEKDPICWVLSGITVQPTETGDIMRMWRHSGIERLSRQNCNLTELLYGAHCATSRLNDGDWIVVTGNSPDEELLKLVNVKISQS